VEGFIGAKLCIIKLGNLLVSIYMETQSFPNVNPF